MTSIYLPEEMNNENVIPFSNEYLQNLYDKNNKQLVGFLQDDKIVTFMERNESKKRYDEKKTITLENNGEEFKHREVESGYTDNNDKSYICGPYSIVEVTNYKSDSFSTILVSNK